MKPQIHRELLEAAGKGVREYLATTRGAAVAGATASCEVVQELGWVQVAHRDGCTTLMAITTGKDWGKDFPAR